MEMEPRYGIRHYVAALVFALIVLASWILVIGHQLDLGALNLARHEGLGEVMLGAYIMTAVTAAVFGAALVSAWLKI